ncbi:MAG: hypothetical protein RL508_494 [Actinomycetota bacterium]
MSEKLRIAVIGLGEAGSLIAAGLQKQGAEVIGYDTAKIKYPPVPIAASAVEAVQDADVVFSINSATVSIRVAQQLEPHLKADALYCDLNTGTPSLKKRLAQIAPEGSFVDVAVMMPVAELAEKTPMAVAGPGAKLFMDLLGDFDLNLDYVSDVAGDAANRELLRSMLTKGMAAVATDYLWAAKAMGLEDWAIEELKNEFDASSATTALRYLSDMQQHAKRRQVEIANLNEVLGDANYQSTMVHGIEATLTLVVHSKKVPFAHLGE